MDIVAIFRAPELVREVSGVSDEVRVFPWRQSLTGVQRDGCGNVCSEYASGEEVLIAHVLRQASEPFVAAVLDRIELARPHPRSRARDVGCHRRCVHSSTLAASACMCTVTDALNDAVSRIRSDLHTHTQ